MVMKHEAITKDIIGAAIAVLNELNPGLDEKLYENALVLVLVAHVPKVLFSLLPPWPPVKWPDFSWPQKAPEAQ